MSDSPIPPRFRLVPSELPDEEPDPQVAALLDFEPVRRRVKRPDGWAPELQRHFIRLIVEQGSPQRAAAAMGKKLSGIEALYREEGADSFRAAWDRAVDLAADRELAQASARITAGIQAEPPHRRKAPSPQPSPPGGEGEEAEMSEDAKLELIEKLAVKFLKKVVAEREARLSGEIVAADFYLRQITALEVGFDLMATEGMGMSAWEYLKDLQRGGHDWAAIADTPFARYLDDKRRDYWAANGEPMRPVALREEYLRDHGDHRTQVDQHTYGATTPPARGFSAEEWRGMGSEDRGGRGRRSLRRMRRSRLNGKLKPAESMTTGAPATRRHSGETGVAGRRVGVAEPVRRHGFTP